MSDRLVFRPRGDAHTTSSVLPRSDLDYYARVDTDSRIVAPIDYDIFEYMRTKQLYYAYVISNMEQQSAHALPVCASAAHLTGICRDAAVTLPSNAEPATLRHAAYEHGGSLSVPLSICLPSLLQWANRMRLPACKGLHTILMSFRPAAQNGQSACGSL